MRKSPKKNHNNIQLSVPFPHHIIALLFPLRYLECANVSPSSFMMLDSGRARTFQQRNAPDVDQAVASCPVNCMHRVSYRELQEFETARDDGDGRTDHKHLNGQGRHTPCV